MGDPIDALTAAGREPTWSAVRSRYWKNRALTAKPGEFSKVDFQRMRKGRAPRDPITGRAIELDHAIPQRTGLPDRHQSVMEVTDLEHSFFDPYRRGVKDVAGKSFNGNNQRF